MAMQTIKATMQMRYGLEEDLDPDQLTTGEWAVSTDTKKIWMCFRPGLVLRMATYEAFEEDMRLIQQILATCQDIQEAVEAFERLANQHKDDAASSAMLSESWAHGETGIREGESEDNSKYWSEQSKSEADRAKREADRAETIAGLEIDSSLSETSTNPVQNRVVTEELNKKLNKDGDASNVNAVFSQSTSRVNISSSEKLSVIFGKIQKFFADLKTVAFTGKYSDLSDKPLPSKLENSASFFDYLSADAGRDILSRFNETNRRLYRVEDNLGLYHFSGRERFLIPSKQSKVLYEFPAPTNSFYLIFVNVMFDISTDAVTVLSVDCNDGNGSYTVRSNMQSGGGMFVARMLNGEAEGNKCKISVYQSHTSDVYATVKAERINLVGTER